MASSVIAVGLIIAATGFVAINVLQDMKHMETQVKTGFSKSTKICYYREWFEPQMTKWEAALILNVSHTANKGKIRDAHG
jgi:DnaJ family protein C protein 19